jgi:hypothetical protein
MRFRIVVCVPLLLAPPPARAADGAKTATELVRQLGDDSFDRRQDAARRLLKLGGAAESAVRKGLTDPDPAVRRECRRLLPRLAGAEREARIRAFLADKRGRRKHDLPGWPRFGKLAGADAAGRRLYVRVLRAEGPLLESARRDPNAASARLTARCVGLRLHLITPGHEAALAEVAALAFLGTDTRLKPGPGALDGLDKGLETLALRSALVKQMRADPALRKLLLAYLRKRTDAARAFTLARDLGLKEASGWALEVAADRKAPAAARASALVLLASVGGKGVRPRLEALLNDTTPVGTKVLRGTTLSAQVRDVALAALVHRSGRDGADFGFPYLKAVPGLKALPEPACLGFATDAERDAALKKWRALARK